MEYVQDIAHSDLITKLDLSGDKNNNEDHVLKSYADYIKVGNDNNTSNEDDLLLDNFIDSMLTNSGGESHVEEEEKDEVKEQ